MNIVKTGYLDKYIKPSSEGGTGLVNWILSQMTENRSYGEQEIWQKIQDSDRSSDEKFLSVSDIEKLINWMVGKIIDGVLIEQSEQSRPITYQESLWVKEWDYPENNIRAFMLKDDLINMLNEYPELGVYCKDNDIKKIILDRGVYMYFIEIYEEHKTILDSFGAIYQNK